jgi:hypothetical protein
MVAHRALIGLLVVASIANGCGSRRAGSPQRQSAQSPSLRTVLGCFTHAGADAAAVTSVDLRVSGGEIDVSFSSFHAFVSFAVDGREARAAADALDRQIAVLQQAGHGVVRGATVYYFDAPQVPPAGAQLVDACVAGSNLRASTAIVALARALPLVQYPANMERRALVRCGALADPVGCACVYRRAARLFSYAQVDGLGRTWAPRHALAVITGLLATCEHARPAIRL